MSAPFRIKTGRVIESGTIVLEGGTSGGPAAAMAVSAAPQVGDGVNAYLEKLVKMIPTEVVGLYLVGSGVIPPAGQGGYLLGWTLFCLLAVIVVRTLGTRDVEAKKPPQWAAVAISSVAFLIWIYSLGGVFKLYLGESYKPFLGSLLVLGWTFVVPMVYKPAD